MIEDKLKDELRNVHNFGLYYQGYRQGVMDFRKALEELKNWQDKKVYADAIYNFLVDSLKNCEDYHIDKEHCCFKEHIRDNKGKLIKCTAYIKKN